MCKPNHRPNIPLEASTFLRDGNDGTEVVPVPTFREDSTPARQLDVSSLSSSELEALRATDPFMYYSIPMDQVDHRNSQGSEEEETSGRLIVTRRSAVSVERHVIPSMEEMMAASAAAAAASSLNQGQGDMSFDEEFDYLDMLESFVSANALQQDPAAAASSLNQDEDMSSDEAFDYFDMESSLAFGTTSK